MENNIGRRDFLKAIGLAAVLPAAIKAENPSPKVVTEDIAQFNKVYLPMRAKFPTGIRDLDPALGGGIRTGNLGLVLGGHDSGKTSLLRTIYRTNAFKTNMDDEEHKCSYSFTYGQNYGKPGWRLVHV